MKPREIDKQIAEKVMGAVPCDAWDCFRVGGLGGPEYIKEKDCGHEKCYPREFPPPCSTNIAHALEALESDKLLGTMRLTIGVRKKYVQFTCYSSGRKGEATVYLDDVINSLDKATAMAICLAALEAVKEEVGISDTRTESMTQPEIDFCGECGTSLGVIDDEP